MSADLYGTEAVDTNPQPKGTAECLKPSTHGRSFLEAPPEGPNSGRFLPSKASH